MNSKNFNTSPIDQIIISNFTFDLYLLPISTITKPDITNRRLLQWLIGKSDRITTNVGTVLYKEGSAVGSILILYTRECLLDKSTPVNLAGKQLEWLVLESIRSYALFSVVEMINFRFLVAFGIRNEDGLCRKRKQNLLFSPLTGIWTRNFSIS